jgi:glutamate-ammonia-ligase adenylyltransferase
VVEVADHGVDLAQTDPDAGHDDSLMSGLSSPDVADVVEASAAPAEVRVALARLLDAQPDLRDRLVDPSLLRAVVATTAASRSLTRLLETDPAAIDTLAALDERAAVDDGDASSLSGWKRLEYLRIAGRDLTALDPLDAVGAALARMASDVLAAAVRMAGGDGLAVIGMGKLGGAELNYASDVDVMFVGSGDDQPALERRARAVVDIARQCFRVDLNLRPEGRDGPLVRSTDSFAAYWDRWAQPWEFQALLKARPVAGDVALGAQFQSLAAERLWGRPFDADSLRSVRAMKERAEADVARRGLTDRELKRGRGGIRDVEFAVQLLQLVHGPADPELRSPTTVAALAELADAGYVDRHDAEQLAAAYRFLRTVEHRLQLVDEQQVHAVPADNAARDRLARVLGYRATPAAAAVEQLDHDLRDHQAAVRGIHERVYFRPLLEAFAGAPAGDGVAITPAAAETRLAAFGFTEAARTRQAVAELTRGLTRSSRLMQQMLPLLLDWLSESPDPDLGLLGLRNVASGPQRSMALATAFRDSPEVARRLCLVLGTSALLGNLLQRNPGVIATLGEPDELRLRSAGELVDAARQAVDWRGDVDARRSAMRRFVDRERLRIMLLDVLGLAAAPDVGRALAALGAATLDATVASLAPAVPFAVVAMGRFGGAELSYGSDLDVLFAYEGSTPTDFAEAERVATAVLRFLSGPVPPVFDVDPDLRPEGKQGPLARSLEGYRAYYERYAQAWERMALVRARPVVGDPGVGAGFLDVVEPFVWHGLDADDRREIRRIKARVESERIPPGEDPQFHLKLGRGSLSDVEFTAQLLQLDHRVPATATRGALDALADAGVLDAEDRAVLGEAYAFCDRTRNRWHLVNGAAGDSLPSRPGPLTHLARSLGTTGPELREDYRRVTRRARRVVERLFYGQT